MVAVWVAAVPKRFCCAFDCVFIELMRLRLIVRAGLPAGFAVLLLSALWALDSLRTDLFPGFGADGLAPALCQAALFFVFAGVAGSISLARRVEFPRRRSAWACAGVGVGLFVVPAALVACVQGWVPVFDRVAVFSLTPVFAVILEPHLQDSGLRQGKAALAAALAGVSGVFTLLGLNIPRSFRAGTALCVLLAAALGIAATNCFAVTLARRFAGQSAMAIATLAGAASAVCFGSAAVFAPDRAWRWSVLPFQLFWLSVVDLPALVLLFWLMRRIGASRLTAPFLLAPLFTILAGLALEPSSPPLRAWLGMALLVGGAGWLVFAPAEEIGVEELYPLNALSDHSPRQPPRD
jgi:drug/metabolite transporter (DMT)-like permease